MATPIGMEDLSGGKSEKTEWAAVWFLCWRGETKPAQVIIVRTDDAAGATQTLRAWTGNMHGESGAMLIGSKNSGSVAWYTVWWPQHLSPNKPGLSACLDEVIAEARVELLKRRRQDGVTVVDNTGTDGVTFIPLPK